MTSVEKKEGQEKDLAKENIHKIKIFLASRNLKAIENVCSKIVAEAKSKNVKFRGPHRLPKKVFKINTRKSPCGEGTNTYENWEMRVYKRRVDLISPASVVKDITILAMDPEVSIDVTVAEL